ncbi:uncharacterized protein LOC115985994 [Quercus lobata]|uniref:uncharacterized protein LOC115985994 n=1 Tax=Quercus lobata TaxID=97700 RepID=UPI001247282B|nr:uncharacterized protein LOC115985994 [Quercus lobata]
MSKGKEKVGGSKQFRWLPPMHEMMLKILTEEAGKGNKPSNTFRAGSFALVAKEITAHFGVECHPVFVENRMRTLRSMWATIQELRRKSGFGWDENLKMITCDAKTYQEEVMAHRKHAEYLNKKIEFYDELAIVVRKDTATGGFAKFGVDIENEPDNGDSAEFVADNVEECVVEKGKNANESSTIGSGISKSRKRGRAASNVDDSVLTDLSDQLKEIAGALKEINRGPVDYTTLYNEVMAMMAEGYSEDMLATAFDHLCENEKTARGFLAKNARLRKLCFTVLDLCFCVKGVWILRFWSDLAKEHGVVIVDVNFDESWRGLRSTFTTAAGTRHVPEVSFHVQGLMVFVHGDDFAAGFHRLPTKSLEKIEYFNLIAAAIEYIADLNHSR